MKKILICLLAVCMLAGLASCAKEKKNPVSEPAPQTVETQGEEAETKESTSEEQTYEKAYAELIADFKTLVEFRFSDAYGDKWYDSLLKLTLSEDFRGIIDAFVTEEQGDVVSNMIAELPISFSETGTEDFGTILHDLNQDKIPELFWVHRNHSLVAVFTYQNGSVVLLDAFWPRYQGFVSESGEVYGWGSGGAQDNRCSVFELTKEGKLEMVKGFSEGTDFFGDPSKVIYSEYIGAQKQEISAARFEELSLQYPREQSDFWNALSIEPLK